jgi:hypothetical protein
MMELQRDFNKLGLQVGRMTGPGKDGEGNVKHGEKEMN